MVTRRQSPKVTTVNSKHFHSQLCLGPVDLGWLTPLPHGPLRFCRVRFVLDGGLAVPRNFLYFFDQTKQWHYLVPRQITNLRDQQPRTY